MDFKSKKIQQEKNSPFLKEKTSDKYPKTRVFFGPEIVQDSRGKTIFLKNIIVWAILSLILLIYISLAIINIFSAPKIIITFPPDNYITTEKTITIRGQVRGGATITINNQQIEIKNNTFEQQLSLVPGVNTIKITAKKKIGSEKTILRQVIVK